MENKDLTKRMKEIEKKARKACNCKNDDEGAYRWYEVVLEHLELNQIEKAASAACAIPQRCPTWIVRAFTKIAEACYKSNLKEEKEEARVFLEMAAKQIEKVEKEYRRKLFLELSEISFKLNYPDLAEKYIDMVFLKLENEIAEIKKILGC